MKAKNTIKLTPEQTRWLFREWESAELDLDLFEEGDWDVEGDWQLITNIYQCRKTDKFYMMTVSRSGSPYSDYHYSFEDEGSDLVEVKMVEKKVVTRTWVEVK